jgi:hypothetical protein
MGYVDDREPTDWKRVASMIAIGVGIIVVISLVGGIVYGVIYYEHLPSPAQKMAEDAAARFQFLEDQRASEDDLCAAAHAAKSAYANVRDAANYQKWATRERAECLDAELKRRLNDPAY